MYSMWVIIDTFTKVKVTVLSCSIITHGKLKNMKFVLCSSIQELSIFTGAWLYAAHFLFIGEIAMKSEVICAVVSVPVGRLRYK